MSSALPAGQPEHAGDQDNALASSTSLFRDIERRRPKNFRGDLGKRSWNGIASSKLGNLGVIGSHRGRRASCRRLRPDLGKRFYATNYENIAKDTYMGWPSNSRYDGDEADIKEDGSNATTLLDSYLGDATEDNSRDEPDVEHSSTTLMMDRASRGRSRSFRGDLGKRPAKSSFRGDLGKRSVRQRRSMNPTDWFQTAADRHSADIKDNTQEMTDPDDLSRDITSEFVKRGRGKSSFRGDLGKRWNQLHSDDLGNGDPVAVRSGPQCPHCYDDATKSSSSTKIDKRPRSAAFRGDLGKRQSSDLLVDEVDDALIRVGDLEALPSLSLNKRPRSQYFRGDLGKRS